MSEYLSKEEIKQWRSSLERITLEEYAARLGKKIEEDKPTNDLVDIVLHGQPVISNEEDWIPAKTERITTIAQRAYEREQDISPSPFSIAKLKLNTDDFGDTNIKTQKKKSVAKESKLDDETKLVEKIVKTTKKAAAALNKKTKQVKSGRTKTPKTPKAINAVKEVLNAETTGNTFRDEIRVVFSKALTDREQKVFDYFSSHKNEIVYAKDLATLLELPRDYVYKYIKNLRAKIEGDKLQNADKGGFILHI